MITNQLRPVITDALADRMVRAWSAPHKLVSVEPSARSKMKLALMEAFGSGAEETTPSAIPGVEELRRLSAEATPGPWLVENDDKYPGLFSHLRGPEMDLRWCKVALDISYDQSRQREVDAAFLVAAVNFIRANEATLAAPRPVDVPVGWKLVPVDIADDDGMVDAGHAYLRDGAEWGRLPAIPDLWNALLAAAPEPPVTARPAVVVDEAMRQRVGRALYENEKARAERARDVMNAATGKPCLGILMEPWEECSEAFLSDADAALEAALNGGSHD